VHPRLRAKTFRLAWLLERRKSTRICPFVLELPHAAPVPGDRNLFHTAVLRRGDYALLTDGNSAESSESAIGMQHVAQMHPSRRTARSNVSSKQPMNMIDAADRHHLGLSQWIDDFALHERCQVRPRPRRARPGGAMIYTQSRLAVDFRAIVKKSGLHRGEPGGGHSTRTSLR
jgi:hypothetical protein